MNRFVALEIFEIINMMTHREIHLIIDEHKTYIYTKNNQSVIIGDCISNLIVISVFRER